MNQSPSTQIRPWLLITFIIVLLGGGGYLGYYFWNQSQTKTTTPTTTTTAPSTITTPPATSTAGWKTFESSDLKVSFKYPPEYGDASITTGKGGYFADSSGKVTEVGKITTITFSNYNEKSGDETKKYIEACAVSKDFHSDRGDADICWVRDFKVKDSYKKITNQSNNPVYIDENYQGMGDNYTVGYLPLQTNSGYVALTFSKSSTDIQFRSDIEKILTSSKNL